MIKQSCGDLVIFSKVAACTSQPVAFNGHPITCDHLTVLRNKVDLLANF